MSWIAYRWLDSVTGRMFEIGPGPPELDLVVSAITGEGPFDDQPVRREILRLAEIAGKKGER